MIHTTFESITSSRSTALRLLLFDQAILTELSGGSTRFLRRCVVLQPWVEIRSVKLTPSAAKLLPLLDFARQCRSRREVYERAPAATVEQPIRWTNHDPSSPGKRSRWGHDQTPRCRSGRSTPDWRPSNASGALSRPRDDPASAMALDSSAQHWFTFQCRWFAAAIRWFHTTCSKHAPT